MKSEASFEPHLKFGEDISLKGGSSPILPSKETGALGSVADEVEELEAEDTDVKAEVDASVVVCFAGGAVVGFVVSDEAGFFECFEVGFVVFAGTVGVVVVRGEVEGGVM